MSKIKSGGALKTLVSVLLIAVLMFSLLGAAAGSEQMAAAPSFSSDSSKVVFNGGIAAKTLNIANAAGYKTTWSIEVNGGDQAYLTSKKTDSVVVKVSAVGPKNDSKHNGKVIVKAKLVKDSTSITLTHVIKVYQGAMEVTLSGGEDGLGLGESTTFKAVVKPVGKVTADGEDKAKFTATGEKYAGIDKTTGVLTANDAGLIGRGIRVITVKAAAGPKFAKKEVSLNGGQFMAKGVKDNTVTLQLSVAGDMQLLEGSTLKLTGLDVVEGKTLTASYVAGTKGTATFKIDQDVAPGGEYDGAYKVSSSLKGAQFTETSGVVYYGAAPVNVVSEMSVSVAGVKYVAVQSGYDPDEWSVELPAGTDLSKITKEDINVALAYPSTSYLEALKVGSNGTVRMEISSMWSNGVRSYFYTLTMTAPGQQAVDLSGAGEADGIMIEEAPEVQIVEEAVIEEMEVG